MNNNQDPENGKDKKLSKNLYRSAEARKRRNRMSNERKKKARRSNFQKEKSQQAEIESKNMELQQENRLLKLTIKQVKPKTVCRQTPITRYTSSAMNNCRDKYASVVTVLKRKLPTFRKLDVSFNGCDIGSGVFGEVKSGFINTISQRVAVKTFSDKSNDVSILAEALIYAEMSGHPNFPFFFGVMDDNKSILMEHVSCAQTLRDRLDCSKPLKWRVICIELVRAIQALHNKSLLHNDLHSGNVLVKYDKYIKIIDFGKSTLIEDPVLYFIKPGTDKHKKYNKYHTHLSFELRNIPGSKVSIKSDIYSIGYLFQKISKTIDSTLLQDLSCAMTEKNPEKRPKLSEVLFKLKQ